MQLSLLCWSIDYRVTYVYISSSIIYGWSLATIRLNNVVLVSCLFYLCTHVVAIILVSVLTEQGHLVQNVLQGWMAVWQTFVLVSTILSEPLVNKLNKGL